MQDHSQECPHEHLKGPQRKRPEEGGTSGVLGKVGKVKGCRWDGLAGWGLGRLWWVGECPGGDTVSYAVGVGKVGRQLKEGLTTHE